MTIAEEIVEILKVDILQEDDLTIETDEDLLTSGTLDSMALIRLVAAIEEKYEIKIPPTDLVIENFININAIEAYLQKQASK
jgi:acyl carrier protein